LYRTIAAITATLLATSAWAGETFSISADVGGTARYVDNLAIDDPDGFGMNLGLRTEVNFLAHVKADLRYVEGRAFSPDEDRFVDLSASGSTPALLVFALDMHELMYRAATTRPGDDQFYLMTGLAVKGRVLKNSLKASVGFTYLSADGIADSNERAMGAYVGAEHRLRTKVVDTNLRAAWFIALDQPETHMGLVADGDVTFKFPVGGAFLGPRFDVTYRNFGLNDMSPLFGQQHEVNANVGLAVHWGTGGKGKK
jgi:hypothetical protein